MIIRMFEYGFRKGKENANEGNDNIKRLYFPKQKVIFFEENKNIEDSLKLIIVFDNDKEFLYEVDVMKYWQYNDEDLFEQDEILGEDFHSMLLAIQNLIEYLNKNYIEDENLEEEVNIMTKSLYDPEVEKNGIEKGIEQGIKEGMKQGIKQGMKQGMKQGIEQNQAEIVLNMLGEGLDEATISKFTKIDIEKVKEIIKKHLN